MITTRLAKEEDLKALAQVYVDIYSVYDVGERWTLETAKKLIEYWYKRQPDLFFVAEDKGKIVGGFVTSVKPWWDGNHLYDEEIFVHPDYQESEVIKLLSKALYEEALRKYDVGLFHTWSFVKKGFHTDWYEGQGFELNKEWVLVHVNVKEALEKLK